MTEAAYFEQFTGDVLLPKRDLHVLKVASRFGLSSDEWRVLNDAVQFTVVPLDDCAISLVKARMLGANGYGGYPTRIGVEVWEKVMDLAERER